MKIKTIGLFLLTLLFYSCKNDDSTNINFEIENNTDTELSLVKIYANVGVTSDLYADSVSFSQLSSGTTSSLSWNFEDLPKSDGDFVLKAAVKNRLSIVRNFGYFSNGKPTKSEYTIKISSDSVYVE